MRNISFFSVIVASLVSACGPVEESALNATSRGRLEQWDVPGAVQQGAKLSCSFTVRGKKTALKLRSAAYQSEPFENFLEFIWTDGKGMMLSSGMRDDDSNTTQAVDDKAYNALYSTKETADGHRYDITDYTNIVIRDITGREAAGYDSFRTKLSFERATNGSIKSLTFEASKLEKSIFTLGKYTWSQLLTADCK